MGSAIVDNVAITIILSFEVIDAISDDFDVLAWNSVERREAKIHPTLPANDIVTGSMRGNASYSSTKLCRRTPTRLKLERGYERVPGNDH